MPLLILLVPLLVCTVDIAPQAIRDANVRQQHWLQLKKTAIDKVAAETLKGEKHG